MQYWLSGCMRAGQAREDHYSKALVEYGETLSFMMKVAVLHVLLSKDLQERVLDKCAVRWDRVEESDAALRK